MLDAVLQRMDLAFIGTLRHKVTFAELLQQPGARVLDVRTPEEMTALLPGEAFPLPWQCLALNQLPENWAEVPREPLVGIFCPHGVRAAMAYVYLSARGYDNLRVLDGGYEALCQCVRPAALLAARNRGQTAAE
ncbi:rhodanese-like domain-containing protein [Desulfuromonas thiophila]|uniref:rhodanese-like domain-containing protein n=1 Tax=Desulfuromonas thiophila TaxID=57664 RepID=UPI0024A98954|nr:rhodanese-like domain-containing protein [Desulfuromonas thiophila]